MTVSKKQEGVTLVIAMVMLAAVTFISFALSTIIIREIVVARLILTTEPAITGASSGGEGGLFQLFRELPANSATVALPQSGAGYQVTSDLYDNSYLFSITGGAEAKVGLYDAQQPNNKQPNPRYASVKVTNNPGSSLLQYQVATWSQPDSFICVGSVSAGSTSAACALSSTSDNRFVIFIQPLGGSDAAGSVVAYDSQNQIIGIPSETQSLVVTGTSGGAQRKIEIKVSK